MQNLSRRVRDITLAVSHWKESRADGGLCAPEAVAAAFERAKQEVGTF